MSVIGCFFLLSNVTASAKTITLNYSDQNGDMSWGTTHATKPWIKKIEEATKGRVKIQAYYSQTLTKGKDAWSTVKSGIADMAWCFHGYWPNMTPLADVVSLPAMPFRSAEKASEVLWKLYEQFPQIREEFADNKVLQLWTTDPYLLITTKKHVKTLEDLKGLKTRMTGGPPTDMMKALGGIPMLIPMPDNYISLQKGVIDGMGTPWEAFLSWRFYEVVKYVTTNTPFPCVYFSLSMNKNKWNSLPKDIQDAIMSVSGLEGSKFQGRNYFDTAKGEVIEKAKAQGYMLEYYNLPESERERWIEIGGKPLWEAWVKKMEKQGKKSAREILNATLKLAKE